MTILPSVVPCITVNDFAIYSIVVQLGNPFSKKRHSHVRDRSFLKMYQLKKYSTDFDKLFFKETRIFSLQSYEEFLSKFHLGDFFTAIRNLGPKFTML